jgi:hypothetical protein
MMNKRIRSSLLFGLFLFLASILFLLATLAYPPKAKLFPLVTLTFLIILLVIQIAREVLPAREKENVKKATAGNVGPRYIAIWAWIGATLVILWIVGFVGMVILLPFLYLRSVKESWLLSVTLPLGCGIFFYGLFGLILRMPLYPGFAFEKIFG